MIIVVPEGKDGWYTDGVAANEKFETYFVEELVPDVQRRFRTVEAREGRVVAGLSMGGYGALKFGLKYPDRFIFAASMSGALGAASWHAQDPLPAFVKPSIARVFGADDSPVRASNDIYKIVREMPAARVAMLPYFYLDCGTEDGLLSSNRDFAALLVERKIPHEYRQLPGSHAWAYWDRQVQEVLRLAAQRLATPR
jgi:S-formylglutathione hydrolase FrmB